MIQSNALRILPIKRFLLGKGNTLFRFLLAIWNMDFRLFYYVNKYLEHVEHSFGYLLKFLNWYLLVSDNNENASYCESSANVDR